jgi:uncharacterized protein (TIRG00374 family)
MPTPGSKSRLRWQTLFIAVLTAGLLWLFFRDLDVGEVWAAIRRADLSLIAVGVLLTLLTYVFRAWRWQLLLAPIGHARFRTAFRTTVIGFTATFLLPARVGEVLRPYLLARQEGFKATATFATIIIERLLDLTTVLLLFALALPVAGVDVGPQIKWAGVTAAAAALSGLAILCLLAGHPERLGRWTARLARVLPARAASVAAHMVTAFAQGLAVLRSPTQLLMAVAWSLPLWLTIAVTILVCSRAFDLTFSFSGTFLVMGALAVGVSLPTPGGAGGFHAAYLYAVTGFFGANEDVAGAAAIVLHAVSFVPVTIVGLVFMWQDGLTLTGIRGMGMAPTGDAVPGR